ncbi:unnamed protein product [Closterium sp. NIES-53]
MYITLYFIVTRLPDSLCAVRDLFLALDPTDLTVDLLEQHIHAAETSVVTIGAARSTPRTPFFEIVPPPPLPPPTLLLLPLTSLVLRMSGLLLLLVGSAAATRARVERVVAVATGVVVVAAVEAVEVAEVVEAVGVVAGVGASVSAVVAAVGVAVVATVGVVAVRVELLRGKVLAVARGRSSSVGARSLRPSRFRRIGLVIEVARTSMIKAAAPHFLWPFAVRYAAHQLNLWPCVSGQGRECYFLLVVDDYTRYTTVFPLRSKGGEFSSDLLRELCRGEGILQSFTLPASPQQNGVAERRIGILMEVARTSMIHATAPHFLWPFAVRYAFAMLPQTSSPPVLFPASSLAFPPDVPGWQFYHPTSRRVLPSKDVTFDKSVPFYHLSPYRTAPLLPPPLFLAPGPPLVLLEVLRLGVLRLGVLSLRVRSLEVLVLEVIELLELVVLEALELETLQLEALALEALELEELELETLGLEALELEALTLEALELKKLELETLELETLALEELKLEALELEAMELEELELETLDLEVLVMGVLELAVLSCPALLVRAVRTGPCVPRARPQPVPGTHIMALRLSPVPLRVPLPPPPASSLRAASATVPRLLATIVTDSLFESIAASALVVELVDFAVACHLDYATSLVGESESDCPPSVGGECALGTDVLEDRQEDLECLAATVPHLVAMLLARIAMDADMASWKSTRNYVDVIPPSGANIVDGMWIFWVKRPPGSPPVFKARYIARGFSQRQGVDFFQTFSPTPKMTTLRGGLHEEIWLRRPPGFTGLFLACTQWRLRRPVYGLGQASHKWHGTLRRTLAALGFAPLTADPLLFLHTDTLLPPFYVLVYVDNLVFSTADTEALALVKSELQKRHKCTDLGELHSYLGLHFTRDRARRTITLTESHMVHQVLQRFGFRYSLPQSTPLPTGHSLSARP